VKIDKSPPSTWQKVKKSSPLPRLHKFPRTNSNKAMSFLLEKSNQNRIAIDLLLDKNLLAPAIHCGYYSCFQRIVYVLKEYYPEDLERIETEVKGRRGNLHGNCFKEFSSRFRREFDKKSSFEIDDLLKQLKGFRQKSDYNDEEITENEVKKVKEYVAKVHYLIRHYMKL